MALVSIKPFLQQARKSHFAIPLFDAFDSLSAEGIFQAFESRGAAGIIAIYAPLIDQPQGEALAAYVKARAERSSAPVSLMLDHGGSVEQCIKAIKLGFSDVMFDGSRLAFEENKEQTRLVVRAAHVLGLGAEAELGHVGSGSEYQDIEAHRKGFTNPDLVAEFVQETQVDFLAVAIGNAHGLYQGEPHLDLSLLEAIAEKTEIPLVLHGGTGISESDFKASFARGIAKVNVATDLYQEAGRRLSESCRQGETSYFKLSEIMVNAFRERCGYFIDLFSH